MDIDRTVAASANFDRRRESARAPRRLSIPESTTARKVSRARESVSKPTQQPAFETRFGGRRIKSSEASFRGVRSVRRRQRASPSGFL